MAKNRLFILNLTRHSFAIAQKFRQKLEAETIADLEYSPGCQMRTAHRQSALSGGGGHQDVGEELLGLANVKNDQCQKQQHWTLARTLGS